jgi:hypothetical protein
MATDKKKEDPIVDMIVRRLEGMRFTAQEVVRLFAKWAGSLEGGEALTEAEMDRFGNVLAAVYAF